MDVVDLLDPDCCEEYDRYNLEAMNQVVVQVGERTGGCAKLLMSK